ncbi:MAG: hypothetical protein D6744_12030, partial [Planctomycetota bacterium]
MSDVGSAGFGSATDTKGADDSFARPFAFADSGGDMSGACSGCPDFDGSGYVDLPDLSMLLSAFGTVPPDPCIDIDGSGMVDLADLAILLSLFDQQCNNGNGNGNMNGGNTNTNGGNGNA